MKKLITSLYLSFSALFLLGQEVSLGTNIIPPSPNAAALAQYAVHPVSLSSGTVSPSIDFGALSSTHLSVPISINYHASGIKTNQEASNVGLGWVLNAGGAISRTVMGRPDEMSGLGYHNLAEVNPNNMTTIQKETAYLLNWDLEPDVYTFNFAGKSGKFIIDRNGVEVLNEPSSIRIDKIYGNWRIIDTDGVQYFFEDKENTLQYSDNNAEVPFVSNWYLSRILHPSGDEIIFNYDIDIPYVYVSPPSFSKFITTGGPNCGPQQCRDGALTQGGVSEFTIDQKLLTSIVSRTNKINLIYDDRTDIPGNKMVGGLSFETLEGIVVKHYDFQYSYFTAGSLSKLKLDNITEANEGTEMPPYIFSYSSTTLAQPKGNGYDHWGYQNKNSAASTSLSYPYTDEDEKEFFNSKRKSDLNSKNGMLTRIDYPTGLFTEFIYELHNYSKITSGTGTKDVIITEANSVSLSCDPIYQNVCEKTDVFTIDEGYESIKITFPVNNCQAIECETWVKITNSAGILVMNFVVTATQTTVTNNLDAGDYTIELENLNNDHELTVVLNYTTYFECPVTKNYPKAGGVRIKKIIDNEGERSFFYNSHDCSEANLARPSGILLDIPTYRSGLSKILQCGNPGSPLLCTECPGDIITSNSNRSFSSGSHVYYPFVKETKKDGSYKETTFSFVPDYLGQSFTRPFVPSTSNSQLRGKPLSEKLYKASGIVVSENTFNYSTYSTATIPIYRIAYDGSGSNCLFNKKIDQYSFYMKHKQLDQTVSRMYDYSGTHYIETIKDYQYDSDYNLTLETTSTIAESTTKEMKYAKQLYPESHFLIEKNMIAIPLEVEVDGVLGTKTEYLSQVKPLPYKQYLMVTGNDYTAAPGDLPGWKLMVEIKDFENGLPTEIEKRGIVHNQIIDWLDGVNFGQIDKVTQGPAQLTREVDYNYNPKRELEFVTNFNGLTNTYTYDGLSRLRTIDEYGKTFSTIDYFYEFVNGGDNKVTTSRSYLDGSPTKNSETIYDVFGRDIQNVAKDWTPQGNDLVISKKYNLSGQIIENCDPTKGSCQTATYEAFSGGRMLTSGFVGWDEESSQTHLIGLGITANGIFYPAGSLTLTISTDENGNVSKSYTNMFDKPVLEVKLVGNNEEVKTYYEYDEKQSLVKITNSNQDEYVYTYFDDGLLKNKTIPQGGTTSFTYDEDGQVASTTMPSGEILTTEYDEYNQFEKLFLDGDLIKDVEYYSTGVETGLVQKETNYILNDLTKFVEKNYFYDGFGRMNFLTTVGIDGFTTSTDTDFDNRDLPIEVYGSVSKNGQIDQDYTSSFLYDSQDRLMSDNMSINGGAPEPIAVNNYFEQGWLKEMSMGSGCLQSVDYLYNSRGWLTNINDKLQDEDDPVSFIMQQDFGDAGGSLVTNVSIFMNSADLIEGVPTSIKVKANLVKTDFDSGDLIVAGMKNHYMINGAALTNDHSDELTFTIQGFYDRNTYVNLVKNKIEQHLLPLEPSFDPEVLTPVDEDVIDIFPDHDCEGCPTNSDCAEDLFYQGLFYDQGRASLNAEAQYNGNIAWTNWKVKPIYGIVEADEGTRAYGFTYDKLNRITEAKFSKEDRFNVSVLYKDHIGNIDILSREGYNNATDQYETIDLLKYNYTNGLLSSVQDLELQQEGAKTSEYGFNTTTGNMESSADVESIEYNYLNLPNLVTLRNGIKLVYSYDADGVLWKRTVVDKNDPRTFHYIGNVTYKNFDMEYIATANGRYIDSSEESINGLSGYEYVLRDHLGNGRVWFMDQDKNHVIDRSNNGNEVTQIEHYYPFGMSMAAPVSSNPIDDADRMKYNGKEFEEDWGLYNYGFRFYDPSIGRFTTTDPLAEKYTFQNPYTYAANNPIRYIDFMGLGPTTDYYNQKGKFLGTDGVDDGNVMVVTDKKEAKSIKKTNKKGGTTAVSDVSSGVMLPNAFFRSEMGKAVDRAGSPSFHEEGGYFGTSKGKDFVVHAKPGPEADPSKDPHAHIDIFKANDISTVPNDSDPTILGTFHTHPDGTVTSHEGGGFNTVGGGTTTTSSFENPPSNRNGRGDIPNAKANTRNVTGNRYVLAQGNKTVYIYNGSGVKATFPLGKFRSIGN